MTDTAHDVARARDALAASGGSPDPEVLGAVHHGLLAVPVDPAAHATDTGSITPRSAPPRSVSPRLAVRRHAAS